MRVFVEEHIDSETLLEVLLYVRARPDARVSARETARALGIAGRHVRRALARLVREGLVTAEGELFGYAPGERGHVIDDLAGVYARRPRTIVGLIYGVDARRANALANAFRIRRRKR